MTARHDLDRRIADFYATESPYRAPDRVLTDALATIETTPQRRALIRVPWRIPSMNNYARLAIAAVVVVAVGAVGLTALLSGRPGPGALASPSPSPSPTIAPTPRPTPTPLPSPTEATATQFVVPFAYLFPVGVEFDYGGRTATFWEARVPVWADTGHPGGIIIQAIGGGRADPCDPASAAVPIAAGPDAVIAYLRSVSELTVSPETATSVDGLPAVQVAVSSEPVNEACPDILPWGEQTQWIPRGLDVRVTAVDVGDEHLAITVFGLDTNPEWEAMVDELIGSIRFQPVS